MSDEELNEVRKLMLDDPKGAGLKAYAQLSETERDRMLQLAREESDAKVRALFANMEADGSMDKIRELYAQDQAKKKNRKDR